MVWWVREDCCGVFCGFMTTFLLCFAAFVQFTFVIGPGLGYTHPLTIFYLFITFMAALSHAKTQFTNPGAVPLNNDQLIQIERDHHHHHQTITSNNSNNKNNGNSMNNQSNNSNNNNNIVITNNGVNNGTKKNDNNVNSNDIVSSNGINSNNINGSNTQTSSMSVVTHKQRDPISRRKQLVRYFNEMQIQARHCERCKQYKPSEAHHCSTCNRCIIKMDHHCPWVNNCVAMMNQKYFVLFLFYTCLCCIFCLISLITRFISCNHDSDGHRRHGSSSRSGSRAKDHASRLHKNVAFSHRKGSKLNRNSDAASSAVAGAVQGSALRMLLDVGSAGDANGNIMDNGNDNINDVIVNNVGGLGLSGENSDLEAIYGDWCESGGLDVMFCMLNMFEGILFGLFTCIMSCDQISSIMNNVTYIDSIQMRRHGHNKSKKSRHYDEQKKLTGMDNLAFIFGEPFGFRWFLPFGQTDKLKKDFRQLCSKFE